MIAPSWSGRYETIRVQELLWGYWGLWVVIETQFFFLKDYGELHRLRIDLSFIETWLDERVSHLWEGIHLSQCLSVLLELAMLLWQVEEALNFDIFLKV